MPYPMPRLFKIKHLRTKFAVAIACFVGLLALSVYAYFPRLLEERAVEAAAARTRSIAEMTAFSVAPGLFFGDEAAIEDAFEVARQNPDLVYLVAEDVEGEAAASFQLQEAEAANYLDVHMEDPLGVPVYKTAVPVVLDSMDVGRLYLGLSLAELHADVARGSRGGDVDEPPPLRRRRRRGGRAQRLHHAPPRPDHAHRRGHRLGGDRPTRPRPLPRRGGPARPLL